MEIKYTLGLEEYLEHQLYTVSQSGQLKKQQERMRLLHSLKYIIMALLAFWFIPGEYDKSILRSIVASFLVIMAILSFVLFPSNYKTKIKEQILAQLKERHGNKIDKTNEIKLNESSIHVSNDESEYKVKLNEIKRIDELNKIILVTMNSGNPIIISKHEITNLDLLKKYLQEIASEHNLFYNIKDKWTWQ